MKTKPAAHTPNLASQDLLHARKNGTVGFEYRTRQGGGGGEAASRKEAARSIPSSQLAKERSRLHRLGVQMEREGTTDSARYADIRADQAAIRAELERRGYDQKRHSSGFDDGPVRGGSGKPPAVGGGSDKPVIGGGEG
ncbi:MAG: hypothetical protein IPJ65_19535 [Archangiaceae bacterium]|nr:hypothetical protein [Archangiaceae bacterium]